MADLPFLDGYGGQTTIQLLALDGKYRVDSLALAFASALKGESRRVGYDGMSAPERSSW